MSYLYFGRKHTGKATTSFDHPLCQVKQKQPIKNRSNSAHDMSQRLSAARPPSRTNPTSPAQSPAAQQYPSSTPHVRLPTGAPPPPYEPPLQTPSGSRPPLQTPSGCQPPLQTPSGGLESAHPARSNNITTHSSSRPLIPIKPNSTPSSHTYVADPVLPTNTQHSTAALKSPRSMTAHTLPQQPPRPPPKHSYSRSDPYPMPPPANATHSSSMPPPVAPRPKRQQLIVPEKLNPSNRTAHLSWAEPASESVTMQQRARSQHDLTSPYVSDKDSRPALPPVCKECGQTHGIQSAHLYDYRGTVDEELCCQVCLQPLVSPMDTPCGHTFCSACLRAHLSRQSWCPTDRTPLDWSSCNQSSLLVRRLLDKLEVVCPNVDYCEQIMSRCDLHAHLEKRCKGAVLPCINADQGCRFQGPRSTLLDSHLLDCSYNPQASVPARSGSNRESSRLVAGREVCVELIRTDQQLGFTLVGGADTPLMALVVQSVIPGKAADVQIGLQSGDQIKRVDGEPVNGWSHTEAVSKLLEVRKHCSLHVYRDVAAESHDTRHSTDHENNRDVLTFTIDNPELQPLGIQFYEDKYDPSSRIAVLDVTDDGLARRDGHLLPGDHVISISGNSVRDASQEQVSNLIKLHQSRLTFEVARDICDVTTPALTNSDQYSEDVCWPAQIYRTKTVHIHKSSDEGLGMSVAGGSDCPEGNVPVFITNVRRNSCMHRASSVQAGDVLLTINGQSLVGVSHACAVSALRHHSHADFVMELVSFEPSTDLPALPPDHQTPFRPNWVYWMSMPRNCWCVQQLMLYKHSGTGSLGFSFVGGTLGAIRQPVLVLYIVPGSPAYNSHRLKCGDRILTVNERSLAGLSHTEIVDLIKSSGPSVKLQIVSWPGTIL